MAKLLERCWISFCELNWKTQFIFRNFVGPILEPVGLLEEKKYMRGLFQIQANESDSGGSLKSSRLQAPQPSQLCNDSPTPKAFSTSQLTKHQITTHSATTSIREKEETPSSQLQEEKRKKKERPTTNYHHLNIITATKHPIKDHHLTRQDV